MSKIIITNEDEFIKIAAKVTSSMASEIALNRESKYELIKLLAMYSCTLCEVLKNESGVDEYEK